MLSGALQFGRRWNTVSSPTLSAISPITWMPVAPVPITATLLPAISTGSCGQWKVWNERPLKLSIPFRRGRVGIDSRPVARMRKRQLSARPSPVREAPQVLRLVVVRRIDPAIELHVPAQAEPVGDVIEIAQVLGLAGEALLPVPFV